MLVFLWWMRVGVFLLQMCEILPDDVCYAVWGDLLDGRPLRGAYRLTRDVSLLKYLYEYRDLLGYLIFAYYDGCEIINLSKCGVIAKLVQFPYMFCGNDDGAHEVHRIIKC